MPPIAVRGNDLEKRWSFGAWLTLAVAVGWLVSSLALALTILEQPSDGWTNNTGSGGTFVFQRNLVGGPSVLRIDDVLLGINGLMLSERDAPRFPPNLQAGQTLRYTIRRGSQVLEVDVPLVRLGAATLGRSIVKQWLVTPREDIVGAVGLLVIAIAFFLRPGNLGARYLLLIFSFYCFENWFGGATSSLYAYAYPLPLGMWYSLTGPQVWAWYFFPSLTLMALAFPVVKYPLRRWPRLLPAALYGLPLSLAIVSTYAELSWHDHSLANALFPVFPAVAGLTVVTIFGSLIHNWLTVREPVARAQLRWLTVGLGAGLGLLFALMLIALAIFGTLPKSWNDMLWLPILLPISMTIAITRYRLFDIDVIIRRTLVYSVLTGLLALAYLGSILVLQNVFQTLTGRSQDQLVVVVSTLAIAALFGPLRVRVQAFIDRRFYRQKYDAAHILAQFAASARDDVDLADVKGRLIGVVDATLQPKTVDVWLRPALSTTGERK